MGFGYTAGVVLLTAMVMALVPRLLTPSVPVLVTTDTAPGWEKLGDVFRYSHPPHTLILSHSLTLSLFFSPFFLLSFFLSFFLGWEKLGDVFR